MLTYLDAELSQKDRKSVIRYMTQYRNLNAIIESKKMDLYPSHTVSYEEKPTQSTHAFHSEVEDYAISSEEIEEYERVKYRLDLAYNSIRPLQRIIWNERFIDGRNDPDVYYGHDITRRTYYREKGELMNIVAGCLNIGTNLHQN